MSAPLTSPLADRPYDVVLFGATGFVGRLTAGYLARTAPPGLRVALAGRSKERLEQVRGALPGAAVDWPLLVVDSTDPADVEDLARCTRVVVTTVGPYGRYGLPLVLACAAAGTAYADLTGEVLFVRDSIDRAHELARSTGARIVHACGFDSVPSDLAVLLAAEQARADDAGTLTDTTLLVVAMKGGASGGTVDSLRHQIDVMKADKGSRAVVADPYSLSPDRAAEPELGRQSDNFLTKRSAGRWVAPFVMASFNTRIVRRSNALQDWAYGRTLRYSEVMGVGRSPVAPLLASGVAVGVGVLAVGMALPPTRLLLDRVLPAPGAGPSQKTQDNGFFHMETTAGTTSGARYRTTVRATGDPGYAATAVMLGESALALALDDLPAGGGVLTPATALGRPLADRLRAAGFTLTVEQLG